MAPLDLSGLSPTAQVLISILIGVAFGFCLEQAGFGDSRRLAAQFYLHEMRVLKVMFTAIVTAMMLVFWGTALGLLRYELLFVNPTYLGSGVLGGLLLGAGFIVGGFCPGTSLVAAATLKLDGLLFFLGCLVGAFVFGETVPLYREFYELSGAYGRITLPEVLGLSTELVVLLVALMAVGAFWGAEKLEAVFGARRAQVVTVQGG